LEIAEEEIGYSLGVGSVAVQHCSGGQPDQSAVRSELVTKIVAGSQAGIVTVDVGLPEAPAGWGHQPASSDSQEQGYDMQLPAEARIAAVVFVGVGGSKVVAVVANTLVASAEAGRRDTAVEARRIHGLLDTVQEQAQRQSYAPSALLR
jgi:hypothetical protein